MKFLICAFLVYSDTNRLGQRGGSRQLVRLVRRLAPVERVIVCKREREAWGWPAPGDEIIDFWKTWMSIEYVDCQSKYDFEGPRVLL